MAGDIVMQGDLQRLAAPGLSGFFGQSYNKYDQPHKQYFEMKTSKRNYEVMAAVESLATAQEKDAAQSISFDSFAQAQVPKWVHKTYALGLKIDDEILSDEQYGVVQKGSRMLGESIRDKECIVHANILNNAFDTNFTMTGGDGLNLCSTAHVNGPNNSNTYSNRLGGATAADADLSESSLEDMVNQISTAVDNRGKVIRLKPKALIFHPNNQFEATRILKSVDRVDTANNDVNALRVMGIVNKTVMDPYLTDTDAFFVTTDVEDGLVSFTRWAAKFQQDGDFTNGIQRYKGTTRFSAGWGDPLCIFGSAGN
jgi:hypothetical protein